MKNKTKKALKAGGIAIGLVAGSVILVAAFIGGGEICREMYYDPENWMNTVFQSAMLGYDHIFDLGWAA